MPVSNSISIDDLIALNDEIAALARAGVPLESGMGGMSGDFAGQLQRVTADLRQRMERGEKLDDALSQQTAVPPYYQALVHAGIKSGRLSSALEGLSVSLRRVAEMRRIVNVAFIYPFIVLATGVVVFIVLARNWAPAMNDVRSILHIGPDRWVQFMVWAGEYVGVWLTALLLFVAAMWVAWWIRAGRASSLVSTAGSRPWGNIPTLSMLRHLGRMATFSELLAMMVQESVPLDEALPLSAAATGDRALTSAAKHLATDLAEGKRLQIDHLPRAIPPLLGWLIVAGESQQQMVRGLRHMAEIYTRRAKRQMTWMTLYLPILITMTMGGSIVIFELMAIWLPWIRFLNDLAAPV